MIELQELLAVGGQVVGEVGSTTWTDWCYDSRLAEPGQCFVALRTERRDGHDFIADAVARGCMAVLCTRSMVEIKATVIQVADVRTALQQWASQRLQQVKPQVIAVTGSVGKTGTKRAIATMLEALGPVFRSRRSFNSLLGLPLALAHLTPNDRYAVLEMGVDRFGEMARLAQLFPPQIAVVTNVAPTHLQYLRDEDHIAAEKSALVKALPTNGWAVLNADDPRVAAMAGDTGGRRLWYGLDEANLHQLAAQWDRSPIPPVLARDIVVGTDGLHFEVVCDHSTAPAFLPLVGRHNVYTALAAVAIGLIHGLTLQSAVERLRLVERQAGRCNLLPGMHGSSLLDDTYNASPHSMLSALETLHDLPARRRFAVLGPMLELGDAAERWHRVVGRYATDVCDVVVTVGDVAAQMAPSADAKSGSARATWSHQATSADAIAMVRRQLGLGDMVLVKGSAAARLEEVVAALLAPATLQAAQTEPAAALLVRQEKAWEKVRVAATDRPTWLDIDLQAIGNNVEQIRCIVGPNVNIMAVLKADAYGHGAIHTARTVLQHGATHLAVATFGEAKALRTASVTAPILILGYTPPWQVRDVLRHDVALTVFDHDVANELSLAAAELHRTAVVHVKVDTGMGRLGLAPEDTLAFLQLLHTLPGIEVEGLFTHLATADSADETHARVQLRCFDNVVQAATSAGLRPPLVHAANSPTLARYPQAYYNLVRPGLLLYGLDPSPETPRPPGFRPALQFKTEVAQVKQVAVGTPVSYGARWIAKRPSRIATIPVGYADGFRRSPAWQEVLVRGQRVPVVGRVCMDYTMLDVTDVPHVRAGDEVVLIGSQDREQITAEEVASWLDTINYEVIAAILPRVPRLV